ncbi:hypothetical protein [Luteibacter sp. SG786]|uniref:hypothetical protein n=1 Tax=Luteibacter sp. SG786 TaxID=2587130 RepID=UPI001423E23D|nr:hypothetical protein [Luteibacter sp. SG786]NII55649.1 hypothetical protein [Luteibacter sp. SG786]
MNATTTQGSLAAIERQIEKLRDTIGGLNTLCELAIRDGHDKDAQTLSRTALDLSVQQFQLYRKKDLLVVTSTEWKDLVRDLEKVSASVDQAMRDIAKLGKAITHVTTLVVTVTKVIAIIS